MIGPARPAPLPQLTTSRYLTGDDGGMWLLDTLQNEVNDLLGLGRLEVDDEGHDVDVVVQG